MSLNILESLMQSTLCRTLLETNNFKVMLARFIYLGKTLIHSPGTNSFLDFKNNIFIGFNLKVVTSSENKYLMLPIPNKR